jgi:hypothetical protein
MEWRGLHDVVMNTSQDQRDPRAVFIWMEAGRILNRLDGSVSTFLWDLFPRVH